MPIRTSLPPLILRLAASVLVLVSLLAHPRPSYALPLFMDDFSDADPLTPAGMNGLSWETLTGTTMREDLDGCAIGLTVNTTLLSVERISASEFCYSCRIGCRYGEAAQLLFGWIDDKNHFKLGITAAPAGSRAHLGLFMVLAGNAEKLAESPLLTLPYAPYAVASFRIHFLRSSDGKTITVEADRDGLQDGIGNELTATITRKEALEKFSGGGRIGIAECYAGGNPRSKPWLIFDSVVVTEGGPTAEPLRAAMTLFADAAAGRDENPGTKEQPVKTLAKAIALSLPGDTITVKPGVYAERIAFPDGRVFGREEAPLTLRSETLHGARVQGVDTKNADFVRLEGFALDGGVVVLSGRGSELRNCDISNAPGATAVSAKGNELVIANNRIRGVSIGIQASGKNNRIEGNDISGLVRVQGDCEYIRLFGESSVARNNFLHGTTQEAAGGGNIHGFRTYAVTPGQQQRAKDILIENNIVTGFTFGLKLDGKNNWDGLANSAENITVRGNVFADGVMAISATRVRNLALVNNTFINMRTTGIGGVSLESSRDGTGTTAIVKNNIFYNCIPPAALSKEAALRGATEITGNLLFTTGEGAYLEEGWSGNIVNKDPLLADVTNMAGPDGKPYTPDDGYRPKSAASPCLDAGVKLDGPVVKDILGAVRPQGAGWDIGACEQ